MHSIAPRSRPAAAHVHYRIARIRSRCVEYIASVLAICLPLDDSQRAYLATRIISNTENIADVFRRFEIFSNRNFFIYSPLKNNGTEYFHFHSFNFRLNRPIHANRLNRMRIAIVELTLQASQRASERLLASNVFKLELQCVVECGRW